MAFEKAVYARVFGITSQAADVRMPVGDSASGTHTNFANPLRASRFWDSCTYILTNVVVASGGSFVVTVQTDAIAGYTGLPIARSATLGGNSPTTVILDNLHKSSASPIPTHVFIDETAGTGNISFQCYALAKQYRGVLSTSGGRSAERILEGTMERQRSLTVSALDTISATGQTANFQGLDKMALWDNAMYWAVVGLTISGTWDAAILGTAPNGITYPIAATTSAMTAAGDKVAIPSNCYGSSPKPSHVLWTEQAAGSLTGVDLVVVAKSGRGSNVSRG